MMTHRLPAGSWVQIWLHGKPLLLKQKLFTEGWEKLLGIRKTVFEK